MNRKFLFYSTIQSRGFSRWVAIPFDSTFDDSPAAVCTRRSRAVTNLCQCALPTAMILVSGKCAIADSQIICRHPHLDLSHPYGIIGLQVRGLLLGPYSRTTHAVPW